MVEMCLEHQINEFETDRLTLKTGGMAAENSTHCILS